MSEYSKSLTDAEWEVERRRDFRQQAAIAAMQALIQIDEFDPAQVALEWPISRSGDLRKDIEDLEAFQQRAFDEMMKFRDAADTEIVRRALRMADRLVAEMEKKQ